MKITISREFGTVEEAIVELEKLSRFNLPVPEKAPRKGRSDAGLARRPYGPRSSTGGPAALEPGNAESASTHTTAPAAPVSPTPPTAAVPPVSSPASPREPSAPAAATPTKEEAHAALKRMSTTKGLGTPACIHHLQRFGVVRFSDLQADRYAEFMAEADAKIALAVAAEAAA